MAQGVLDADVYPEVARGILSALWHATAHPSAQASPPHSSAQLGSAQLAQGGSAHRASIRVAAPDG